MLRTKACAKGESFVLRTKSFGLRTKVLCSGRKFGAKDERFVLRTEVLGLRTKVLC